MARCSSWTTSLNFKSNLMTTFLKGRRTILVPPLLHDNSEVDPRLVLMTRRSHQPFRRKIGFPGSSSLPRPLDWADCYIVVSMVIPSTQVLHRPRRKSVSYRSSDPMLLGNRPSSPIVCVKTLGFALGGGSSEGLPTALTRPRGS